MRKSALLLTVSLAVFVMSAVAIAQVQELPNVPLIRHALRAHPPTVARGPELPACDAAQPRPPIVLHGRPGAGALPGCADRLHREEQSEEIASARSFQLGGRRRT